VRPLGRSFLFHSKNRNLSRQRETTTEQHSSILPSPHCIKYHIPANALYADCLTIQNAARLQYPAGTDAAGNAKNITERARFLLEEFPPRDREKPDGGTQPSDTPPSL
jgi:hypothetical protein